MNTNAISSTVTNIVTMVEKESATPVVIFKSFVIGVVVLIFLSIAVYILIRGLHKWGKTGNKPDGFSTIFALFEQALFYIAAVAGQEIFGFAVAGWLVMKSASKYARWQVDSSLQKEEADLAHNRYLIFVLGTGLSIAAGGVAGAVYHFALEFIK